MTDEYEPAMKQLLTRPQSQHCATDDGNRLPRYAAVLTVGTNGTHSGQVNQLLRANDCVFACVGDIEAASLAIPANQPALVVLTLSARERGAGERFTAQLKANRATAQIAVLVISSEVSHAARMGALESGADAWFDTPFDSEVVWLTVRNLLRLAASRNCQPVPSTLAKRHLTDAAAQGEILDALPATIAVFDREGVVVSVNQSWRSFAERNGYFSKLSFGIGSNYLAACESVPTSADGGTGELAAQGIRDVLNGKLANFSMEYPCHSPDQQRWFHMTVSPVGDGPQGAVTMHVDITQKYVAKQSLRDRDTLFRQMAENIRDVFFLVDGDSSRVRYVSPAYEEIFGRTCASLYTHPRSWMNMLVPGERASFLAAYALYRKGERARFDHLAQIMRPDGQLRWISFKVFTISADSGSSVRLAGVAQDITDSVNALSDLRESERRFLELLNNSMLLSVMLDLHGRITFCNAALLRLAGRSALDVIGENWFDLFSSADTHRSRIYFNALLTDSATSARYESELGSAGGERRLICWNSSVLHDRSGAVIGTASIGEDVTDQKKSAMKILALNADLEEMSSLLIHAQEQERISLARELHDELGQRLALLKIDLHHLRRFVVAPAASAAWQSIDRAVVTLIAQIRVISASLRPPALDYLGLESALRELLALQFASSECDCVFEYAGLPAKLAPSIEIAVYRIVQESITNIVRHANATRVVVEVNGGEAGRELELIVRDNGIGLSAGGAARSARADGSGAELLGMKERIRLLGGSFDVKSSGDGGTRVTVGIPLHPAGRQ